jgi:hypothetical protein
MGAHSLGGRSLRERTGLRYPRSRIRDKKKSAADTSRMARLIRSRRQPRVPERASPKDSANWRASRSSVRMSRFRDLARARPSASPGPRLLRSSPASISSDAVGTATSSQSQAHLGIRARLSPSVNSSSTEGGTRRGEKSARKRSGRSMCAKLLRTVVSERAALIRSESIQECFSRAAISRRASSIEDGPMRRGTPSRRKRSCNSSREKPRSSAALPRLISVFRYLRSTRTSWETLSFSSVDSVVQAASA